MNYLQQLQNWSKSDTLQGWIMLCMAMVLIVMVTFIYKSVNPLLRGMLVPISLLLLMNLGYGGYLVFKKSKNVVVIKQQFQRHPNQTIKNQLTQVQKEDKSYTKTTTIWAVFLVISVVLYFVFGKDYYKGVALGLMVMFLGMLIIDAFLHHSLKAYLSALKEYI